MASNTIKFSFKLSVDGKEQLVTTTASAKELQNAINGAKDKATELREKLISFNQLTEVARNVSSGIQQITGTLNSLTAESRGFSAAMATANTMAGKSGEDFAKLKDEVSDLSKTVPVARDALANGLYQVISNGVPEDNWISFLDKSARASVGGIADLQEVVKVTSTMIKNYGLSWDQAGAIQDKIQLTAKNGVTSFEQLAQALPRVGANAATLGVSIDELMATFATLTGVSGNTAEVSTQLAAVFTALIKPSTEAQKTADLLGVKFDAASVKAAGGLQNFLKELDKAVQQYSSKTGILSQEIYGKLFGSAESLRALTPLMGNLSKKFDENIDAMKDSAGTMDDAFDTMANTGASKTQLLINKLAGIGDVIATGVAPMLPFLNVSSQMGMSLVGVMSLVGGIKNLVIALRSAASGSVLFKTVTLGWTASLQLLRSAFTGATIGATTLKVALRGLLATTVIGAALAALGFALEKLIGLFDDTGDKAQQMGDKVQQTTGTLEDHKNRALAPVAAKYDELKAKWETLKTTQEKNQFIKDNSAAFSELGVGIDSVSQAEDFFVNNTANVVKAMDLRAEAAANAAMAEESMQKALAADAKVRQIHQRNVTNYKNQNHTGNSAHDMALDALVDNGGIRVTSGDERAARKEAADARAEAHSYNTRSAALQGEAGKTLNKYPQRNRASGISGKSTHLDLSSGGSSKNKNKHTDHLGDKLRSEPVSEEDFENNYKFYDKKINQYKGKDKELIASWQKLRNAAKDTFEQMKFERENGGLHLDAPDTTIKKVNVHDTAPGLMEGLQADLKRAQDSASSALTVDAYVKAKVRAADIQRQIDSLTNGELTIPVEAEPVRIEKGSKEDKRQSYQNAQAQSGEIQQMFDLKIIGADEAQSSLDKINAKLKELHIDPIKIDFRTKGEKEAAEAVKSLQDSLGGDFSNTITQWQNIGKAFSEGGNAAVGAGSAIAAVGSSMQQMAGDGAAAKVGAIMAAIGQLVLGFATATSKAGAELGPFGWIGFAIAGAATLASIIAQVSSFSTGGIVGGTSYHGDKVPARVNSGEMVLTMKQQKRLFDIANGLALPRMPIVSPDASAVDSMVAMPALSITMKDKLEGTTVRKQIRNVEWIYSKVGKEWKA